MKPYADRGFLHRLPAEDAQLVRCCAKVDSLPRAAAWNDSEGTHRCCTSRLTQLADFFGESVGAFFKIKKKEKHDVFI